MNVGVIFNILGTFCSWYTSHFVSSCSLRKILYWQSFTEVFFFSALAFNFSLHISGKHWLHSLLAQTVWLSEVWCFHKLLCAAGGFQSSNNNPVSSQSCRTNGNVKTWDNERILNIVATSLQLGCLRSWKNM